MELICPNCQRNIPAAEVNVQTDVAKCSACESIYRASDLVETQHLEENPKLPEGSTIEYQSTGTGVSELIIPRKGLAGSVFPVGFATFWVGFIAFWTWGASQASLAFALFSIPFWIVGIVMWWGILRSATERQSLRLDGDGLTLSKNNIFSRKSWRVNYGQIDGVRLETLNSKFPLSEGQTPSNKDLASIHGVVTLNYGVHKLQLGENLSGAEITWLFKLLKAVVSLKSGKRV